MREIRDRRGGFVVPIVLILLGVMLLLSNIGVIGWDVWQTVLRLWPVLLILLGIEYLLGYRTSWGLLLIPLVILLVAGGLWAGRVGPTLVDPVAMTEISRSLENATSAEVEIGPRVGTLKLGALPRGSGLLIAGTLHAGSDELIDSDFRISDGVAHYRLHSRSGPGRFLTIPGERREWELQLNSDVPLRLRFATGVGRSDLDLEDLLVTELNIETGVGETRITLPRQGQVGAVVGGGVGSVTIVVPKDMQARIQATPGLGGLEVVGDYRREDNVYTSPGYETATNRLDLRVTVGVGRVVIR